MIQRVVRQIKTVGLSDDIVVATGINQKDSIENQLGNTLSVVTESCRRDTSPAIVLACSYLASKGTSMDEPVIVMPCDSYTEDTYFSIIAKMSETVAGAAADLVLMGITPTYPSAKYGNVVSDSYDNTYIINELELPIVCIGAKDTVVAASPDGVLVLERKQSENLKHLVDGIGKRPMYEERRWGEYKVIDYIEFLYGFCALTKQLTLRPDCSISYQRHSCREEIWTFINGEGEVDLDGERRPVKRGDVVDIPQGAMLFVPSFR